MRTNASNYVTPRRVTGKLRTAALSEQRDCGGASAASRMSIILAFATLLTPQNTSAEEARLAATGYVFWDSSGELGDLVMVRVLPKPNDKRITVALYGEIKGNGNANWVPIQVSGAGQEFGYASRRIPGAVQSGIVVYPNGVEPVDVPLQIPAYAYFLPAGRFILRYRIRTLIGRAGKPDVWGDDKVLSETEVIERRATGLGKTVVDTQSAPAFSGARAPKPAPQGPAEPRVKKFTLGKP